MTNNKKFSLLFLGNVLLPVLLIFGNNYLAENRLSEWSNSNRWIVSEVFYIIGILGCILILKENYKTNFHNRFWNIFIGLILVFLAILFFITISFSNFGF